MYWISWKLPWKTNIYSWIKWKRKNINSEISYEIALETIWSKFSLYSNCIEILSLALLVSGPAVVFKLNLLHDIGVLRNFNYEWDSHHIKYTDQLKYHIKYEY